MIDRLKELEAATGRASPPTGTSSFPDETVFFSKVDEIKDLLKQVEALIKRIEYLHRQALVAVSNEASQGTQGPLMHTFVYICRVGSKDFSRNRQDKSTRPAVEVPRQRPPLCYKPTPCHSSKRHLESPPAENT